jgi:hypothetical protein
LENLTTSPVYKCLDKKTIIFGFEIIDLFALCLLLALLNFVSGNTAWKMLFTWIPTVAAAMTLRIVKVGKPDNFLTHWVRYQIMPGVFSAFPECTRSNGLSKFRLKIKGNCK